MVAKDGWRVDFVVATKGLNRPDTEVGGVAVTSVARPKRPVTLAVLCQVLDPKQSKSAFNDPSSATAATRLADCNRGGPPPFAAAHG